MALLIRSSKSIAASPHYKWWVYIAVATGVFVAVMDNTGVGIALPKIADHFNVDIPTVQWIPLSYVLSASAMFMPVGRLSDMIGRKRVYLTGLLIFMGAAAVGGASPVFPLMIVAKIVQGIGAAGIQANGMAMIIEAFPERERGKALGQYSATIGVGLIAGPVIGGLLVSELGWRSVFFANVPIGLIALILALVVIKDGGGLSTRVERRFKFDWAGAGLSSGAFISFILGMTNAHRFGWDSPLILASFLIAVALFAGFIWRELNTDDPMLDLSFFRSKAFSMGVSARFLFFLGTMSSFFLMPFYLIKVLNYEPKIAGLFMVPNAVCMATIGPISGRLSDRVGTKWLTVAGLAVSAAAMFIFSRLTVDSSPALVAVGMMLSGIGAGLFSSPNTSAITATQGRERYSLVSGIVNLARTAADVSGLALATTIVTATMASLGYEPSLGAVSEAGGEGTKAAFVSGMSISFLTSFGLVLAAMVILGVQGRARQIKLSLHELRREPGPLPHTTGED